MVRHRAASCHPRIGSACMCTSRAPVYTSHVDVRGERAILQRMDGIGAAHLTGNHHNGPGCGSDLVR